MTGNVNHEFNQAFGDLITRHWSFMNAEWPVVEKSKYHRSSIKEIPSIGMVKEKLAQSLGYIPVFFFLVILFGTRDYSGPYSNVEKGLLLLYQLITGASIADMQQFIPKSSFHQLYKEFYDKQGGDLSRRISKYLSTMFSNVRIRLLSAAQKNPADFRHVTLFLDGHDTRASYSGASSSAMYSYKLKKSGFRTQVCIDVNDMILFMSEPAPCRDYNDGTMFAQMDIGNKIHRLDCVALDGGYNQVVEQVVADSSPLSLRNFCCPIRKQPGVPLTSSEALYNKLFGSLRSRVEATFGELVTTFHKFSHEVPVRVTTVGTFQVQFQLACLLLNIKTFVRMLNIQPLPHQSLWLQAAFDFPSISSLGSTPIITDNIERKLAEATELLQLQQEFLTMGITDDDVENISEDEDENGFEVESILGHKGSGNKMRYLVKWKGYTSKHNSWVRVKDLNAHELVEEYWGRNR